MLKGGPGGSIGGSSGRKGGWPQQGRDRQPGAEWVGRSEAETPPKGLPAGWGGSVASTRSCRRARAPRRTGGGR